MRASRITFPAMLLLCAFVFTLLTLFSLRFIIVPAPLFTLFGWIYLILTTVFWSVQIIFICALCTLVVLFALTEIRTRKTLAQAALQFPVDDSGSVPPRSVPPRRRRPRYYGSFNWDGPEGA